MSRGDKVLVAVIRIFMWGMLISTLLLVVFGDLHFGG